MIIVSGRIHLRPGERETFLASSREAMVSARKADGCRDFIVAPDPLEADRVNVYEEWDSEAQLLAFRGEGPSGEMMRAIMSADVRRHEIAMSGPASRSGSTRRHRAPVSYCTAVRRVLSASAHRLGARESGRP